MFGQLDAISTVEASIAQGADRASVQDAVKRAVGSSYVIGGVSTLGTLVASLQVSQAAFNMFGLFALATGGFIILNTFRTVVAERRHDVGMLRALGASRGSVVGMFLIEAVIQGVLGTGLGLLAGWAMAAASLAALAPLYERVIHLSVGQPVFEMSTWVISITLGVGVTVLGALIPALSAGRLTPLEALRPQVSDFVYRRGVGRRAWVGIGFIAVALLSLATRQDGLVGLGSIAFLIGIALLAPAIVSPLAGAFSNLIEIAYAREGAVARSNIQRNPGRSAITVSAVMLGLAAVVAMAGVVVSIFAGFLGYLDKSLGSDYILIPRSIVLSQSNVGAGPKLANEVRHTPGIGSVATLRLATGKIAGNTVQAIGIVPTDYARVASFEWAAGSSESAVAELDLGRTLIANGIYAAQNGVAAGDRVIFETPAGPKTYRVAGIGSDYLNAKLSTVYVSQDNLAKDFNTTTDLLVLANVLPGADRAVVQKDLDAIASEFPAFRVYSSTAWRQEQQAIFDQTIVAFYVLMGALALPSLLALLNTLAMSVLSRTREIGMLRAVGSTRRQVRRMVMAESLLLTSIGISFGIIAGVWLGYALVGAMNSAGWPMPFFFPWAGILATIVVGLLFGVLAALIPAHSAAKLNVVDALHYE
jgi:putative ABC transport system permease protein